MQFNIKYNRIGNKFFFISNLSEWHFSCRDYYNEIWLNEVGPLTREEKDSLFEIREILQKYDFNKYLGLFFMTSNENTVWSLLKKHIEEEEVHILKKVFKVFE
ncbi:hypothetical protein KKC45_00670, partial [Patescibacteria group bacterium]|nr:hypothetical protein [Patescibacteria group bacterium]